MIPCNLATRRIFTILVQCLVDLADEDSGVGIIVQLQGQGETHSIVEQHLTLGGPNHWGWRDRTGQEGWRIDMVRYAAGEGERMVAREERITDL